jgi:metal-sulfur cluster biosynthetic enzyme
MKNKVMNALEKVIDPEIGMNIVEMGLIKSIEVKGKTAYVRFHPTSPFCPMMTYLTNEIKQAAKAVKGIEEVEVEVV